MKWRSICFAMLMIVVVGSVVGAAEVVLTDGRTDARRYYQASMRAEFYASIGITAADLGKFPKCGHEAMKDAFTIDDKTIRIDDSPASAQVYSAFVTMRADRKLWAIAWTEARPAVDCATVSKCETTGDVVCSFINATLGPINYSPGTCGFICETGTQTRPVFVVNDCE